jgi:trk system potassium uptake protein
MKVVIVGCGRVGSGLASRLSSGSYNVVVVDRNPQAFERLPIKLLTGCISGNVFDREVLQQAGGEDADALVALTNDDNTNILAALIGRREFSIPRVIARVYDPERAEVYRGFGIPTISTTVWATNEIVKMLAHVDLSSQISIGNGEVDIFEIELPVALTGHSVYDMTVPGEIMVTTIVRQGKALIPFPSHRFQEGDVLYLTVLNSAINKVKNLMGYQ